MILHSYWRSTTSYRTKIALNMKQLSFESREVNLLMGDQRSQEFEALNPSMGVPALELDDGNIITQSMAIILYLDKIAPTPAFLPMDPITAAKVTAVASVIACDIHPVNNLKVVTYLKKSGFDQDASRTWMNHWMNEGLAAYQNLIPKEGEFSFGNEVSLADICLIPQLYNAHRWGLDMSPFERLSNIEKNCLSLPEFKKALPENQPDSI